MPIRVAVLDPSATSRRGERIRWLLSNPVLSRRRFAVEIVYEVLSACSDGVVTKTTIMYHSHLNHEQVQRYLTRLAARGLIETDGTGLFHLTPQGETAFEQVSSVVNILQGLGRDMDPAVVAI